MEFFYLTRLKPRDVVFRTNVKMVVTVKKPSLFRLTSLWSLYPMFHLKNIRELTCVFVTVCILISQSLANDQEFMEDFLKREYSLAKPYRGKLPPTNR